MEGRRQRPRKGKAGRKRRRRDEVPYEILQLELLIAEIPILRSQTYAILSPFMSSPEFIHRGCAKTLFAVAT